MSKNKYVDIMIILRKALADVNVKIIICLNLVKYIKTEDREALITEAHCSANGGHKGVFKTTKRLKQKYNWEHLKEDVQQFIQKCLTCQLKKLVRVKTKNPMIITESVGIAMYKIYMDVVGPCPVSNAGYKYILTMQCALTKYVVAAPMFDQTSQSVCDAFIRRFICVYGAPAAVVTDQGSNFLSSLTKRVAKRFKIKQYKTTSYHPQSNTVERSHIVLSEFLKTFISETEDWGSWIDIATFSYNTSVSEATLHTPFELLYGRLARLPSSDPLEPEDRLPSYDNYLIDLATRLQSIQGIAREKLVRSKLRSKHYYDKNINEKSFRIGDSVFLLRGGKIHKWANQYTGPHKVLDVFNNGNVKIRTGKNKSKIVHINRLKYSYINDDQ